MLASRSTIGQALLVILGANSVSRRHMERAALFGCKKAERLAFYAAWMRFKEKKNAAALLFERMTRGVQEFLRSQNQSTLLNSNVEVRARPPLFGSGRCRRWTPADLFYTVAAAEILPSHSPTESGLEFFGSDKRKRDGFPAEISLEDQVFVEKGRMAMNQLWSIFNDDGMWTLEKQLENGDRVFTADVAGCGKTFRIDTVVHGLSARQVFHDVVLRTDTMTSWNSSVEDINILRRIDEHTIISLEVSKPAAMGWVQEREFVAIHRRDKVDNSYVSGGISEDYPLPETGRVRGYFGLYGIVVAPYDGEEITGCKFSFILNTNLKGSVPQYFVNKFLTSQMVDFVSSMKRYLGVADD